MCLEPHRISLPEDIAAAIEVTVLKVSNTILNLNLHTTVR